MGEKYLSDVLSGQDIVNEKTQLICVLAGVGAGKNTFVKNELIHYGNTLYISSRRATVDAMLEDEAVNDYISWNKHTGDILGVTNFGVERIVKNKMFPESLDEIISHFDFVVVDEMHSLFADATYATSSFYVLKFIEYVEEKYPAIKIIGMTGTPEPIESYLTRKKYKIIDKREECIHVLPKAIRIIDKETAFEYIKNMPTTEKTVYYSNSATKIVSGEKSLVAKLADFGVNLDEIGVCMSEDSISKHKASCQWLPEKCEQTKEIIQKTSNLDEKHRIFLTTSCMKEGVNIKNENIRVAFCESHILSEIRQFAGRIRYGLDVLYIIDDARQHLITEDDLKKFFLSLHYGVYSERKNANNYLDNAIKAEDSALYWEWNLSDRGLLDLAYLYDGEYSIATLGGKVVPAFIKVVEERNQYIRFNYLTNRFEIFGSRYIEQRRVAKIFKNEQWLDELEQFAKKYDIDYKPLKKSKNISAESKENLIAILNENKNKILSLDDKTNMLNLLRFELSLDENVKYTTITKRLGECQIAFSVVGAETSKKRGKRGIRIIEGNRFLK